MSRGHTTDGGQPTADPVVLAAVQTSNNTSSHFLGASPKSWMANPSGNVVPATRHPQQGPMPPKTAAPPKPQPQRSQPEQIQTQNGDLTSTSAPSSVLPPQNTTGSSALPPSQPDTRATWSNVSPAAAPQAERSEPSNRDARIEPVEELATRSREGQDQAADLRTEGMRVAQQGLAQGSPSQGPHTSPLQRSPIGPPAHQRPLSVAATTPVRNAHHGQSVASPAALPTASTTDPGRKRQHSANDSSDRRTRVRRSGDASQLPTPQHPPTVTHRPTLQQRLEAALHSLGPRRTIDQAPILDDGRVTLLRRACRNNDDFFILAHALCCAFSASQRIELGFPLTTAQTTGLRILHMILGSNRFLTKEMCQLLSTFPKPLPALVADSRSQKQGLLEAVVMFLHYLSANFDGIQQRSRFRGYPPCPAELIYECQLPSAALLCALFILILQKLGMDTDSQRHTVHLFEQELLALEPLHQCLGVLNSHHGAQIPALSQMFATKYSHLEQQFQYMAALHATNSATSPTFHEIQHPAQAVSGLAANGAPGGYPIAQHSSYQFPAAGTGVQSLPVASSASVSHAPHYVQTPTHYTHGPPNSRRVSQVSNSSSGSTPHSVHPDPVPQGQVLASHTPPNPHDSHLHTMGVPPQASRSTRSPRDAVLPAPVPSTGIPHQTSSARTSFSGYVPQNVRPNMMPSAIVQQTAAVQPMSPGLARQPATFSPSAAVPQHGARQTMPPLHMQQAQSLQTRQHGVATQPPSQPQEGYFFPRSDKFNLPLPAVPRPDRNALHQSHLRSPEFRKISLGEGSVSDVRYYQYVEDFIELPDFLSRESDLTQWKVNIPHEVWVRKAQSDPPTGEFLSRYRNIVNGCVQFSLKSVLYKAGAAALPTPHLSDFCVQSTKWPKCLSVSVNGDLGLDFRRKVHFGVDMTADITDLLKEGDNEIVIGCIFTPEEMNIKYFMAIEIICVNDHTTVMSMPARITAAESLSSLTAALKADGEARDDDDLIISQPAVSIDLLDPFMSVIWVTPVRGRDCQHRECFDLEAYLLSRTSRFKNSGLISVDQWKCPICKKDARPPMLVIDEFLLEVRKTLEQSRQLDARAILVKEDGTWETKVDQPPGQDRSKADGKARPSATPSEVTPRSRQPSTIPDPASVIVLDDDDD